ncbi:DUF721 domain-containing protein [Leucobacter viscericola]|uniref:DUF721 domain-containing protein n=1 Tax=Leucobacter viscericola TaxID=2714935 RepID=A0A6G7XFP6_9MICO|nr:DciA family protein [Leucobacter viscericola]QIK63373.1 DUF721 domain-containing protein [Leucobacter viscericola]
MTASNRSEFLASAYLHAKSVWRGKPVRRRKVRSGETEGEGTPFGFGRDPKALVDVLSTMATDMGWSAELDQARVIEEWAEFAGESTAEHTTVIGISNGVLQVQCDSTTWATELRRLRGEMLTRLLKEYPDAEIRDLRFMAPGAPSWRHGPRTVQGRGPRDTYG